MEFLFYYVIINFFSKYAWVISSIDKKVITVDAFQKILDESNCKPNKIWDRGRE